MFVSVVGVQLLHKYYHYHVPRQLPWAIKLFFFFFSKIMQSLTECTNSYDNIFVCQYKRLSTIVSRCRRKSFFFFFFVNQSIQLSQYVPMFHVSKYGQRLRLSPSYIVVSCFFCVTLLQHLPVQVSPSILL